MMPVCRSIGGHLDITAGYPWPHLVLLACVVTITGRQWIGLEFQNIWICDFVKIE